MSERRVDLNGLTEKWRRSRELAWIAGTLGERGSGRMLDLGAGKLEAEILSAPIHSPADAIAKLRAVNRIFRQGERADGAEAAAIDQIVDWLEKLTIPYAGRVLRAQPIIPDGIEAWQAGATRQLRVTLRRHVVTDRALAQRLTATGVPETEASVCAKIERGAYPAWWLFAALRALGLRLLRLD